MPAPYKLTRCKRRLFQSIVLLAVYGLMEAMSFAYLTFLGADHSERRGQIAQMDPFSPAGPFSYPMMIHPYIGIVYKPREKDAKLAAEIDRATEYGFYDRQSPIRKRKPDRIIIGLMGGSVARQLGTTATEILKQALSKVSQFQGRTIEFVQLAIDGNKQPQQLMTLNYLLTLGAEFDLMINLDGLNEIALPEIDNIPFGVSAAYPRKWGEVVSAASSLEMMRMFGYMTYLRSVQRQWAAWFDAVPLRYSPTAALGWYVQNDRLNDLILEQHRAISRVSQQEITYCASGPPETFDSEEQLLAHCADIWARSSVCLQQLCQANQIRYFHFLQPNQYLTGSKPMMPDERRVALSDKSPFNRPVRLGYPLMQAKGEQFLAAGVVFTDLTQAFAKQPESIYIDDCCHVSDAGDQILAAAIAARITEWYESH